MLYFAFRPDKQSVPSRAYLAFKDSEQVSRFSREYDGHAFRDKQGAYEDGSNEGSCLSPAYRK